MRLATDAGDRRDVLNEIEVELVVESCIDRTIRTDQEEYVAVRGGARDHLGADVTAGTRPVFNNERLPEPLRQPLSHQPGDDVRRAASGKADDHAHRS